MADDERTAAGALIEQRLEAEPYAFDAFTALRRLECTHRDKPRLGTALRPVDEPIRLGQEPSLSFVASTLARYEPGKQGAPARLLVHFFGALGPNGPLPLHLTEYARQRLHHQGDPTFTRFLDLFHHRLLCLFYRAWANTRPTVEHDREEENRFTVYLGSVFGLGLPSLQARDAFPDHAKLFYAGRFAQHGCNPEGLRAIIAEFFAMPAAIEPFVGEWLEIPREYTWRLGAPSPRGPHKLGLLGDSTILGARSFCRQHKFRIVLGPLRRDQFRRMQPGGESVPRLCALVRQYLGDELKWDLRLVLLREAAQPIKLGVSGQLGRTSWLLGAVSDSPFEDLVFDPQSEAKAS